MIMSQYESLVPLLLQQDYIEEAFVNPNWIYTGGYCGDQPWRPQDEDQWRNRYEQVYHLTYRSHPGVNSPVRLPCMEFIAWQQGLQLEPKLFPWITVREWYSIAHTPYEQALAQTAAKWDFRLGNYITYSFNPSYPTQKAQFLAAVLAHCNDEKNHTYDRGLAIDVGQCSWKVAAALIRDSVCFLGCRSANYVLAHGVGQKHIFTYEPDPARHQAGSFGDVFRNPYNTEVTHLLQASPEEAAQVAIHWIENWKKEKHDEIVKSQETSQTVCSVTQT